VREVELEGEDMREHIKDFKRTVKLQKQRRKRQLKAVADT
jgi:hypothetical protein